MIYLNTRKCTNMPWARTTTTNINFTETCTWELC